jgi:hypothetical protein
MSAYPAASGSRWVATAATTLVAQNQARPGGSALDARTRAPSQLHGQPVGPQTGEGDVRLDEDRWEGLRRIRLSRP